MLLALQLVLGLQLQAAQAVASPTPMSHVMSAHAADVRAAGDVATAADVAPAADAALASGDADNASGQPDCPQHSTPHDCCHASACQCHCVYTPGAIALPSLADIAASVAVPSLATTQFVAPRIDEFLRPPIA